MRTFANQRARHGAFTLVDFLSLVVISLIAVSILNAAIGSLRGTAERSRLQSDIRALNHTVYLFRASGGDLSDALTPDQVIAKMQATEVDRLTLTVNSVMVNGLKPVFQSPREAMTDANRAFWNAESQSFEVRRDGKGGIKAFHEEF